jgi:hypothetical protein
VRATTGSGRKVSRTPARGLRYFDLHLAKVESYDHSIDVGKQKRDPERALEDYNHATRIGLTYATAHQSRRRIQRRRVILRMGAPNTLPCRPCRPSIVLQDNARD